MKITLRPYSHDKRRWHIDIRLMNPCNPDTEIRRRKVAPAGLSKAQARAWGERQVQAILREALEVDAPATKEVPHEHLRLIPKPAANAADAVTLADFYAQRFEPEHVRLQKRSTQVGYGGSFRNHILPQLGELPLVAIDSGRILAFRAKLRGSLAAATVNLTLARLRTALRYAVKVGLLAHAPEVEKLRVPRQAPKSVLSAAEIERLLKAAATIDPTVELICLLCLHAGLRGSEVCALEWADVDLEAGTLVVQHNTYRGHAQTPKGRIGRLALSARLRRALESHRRREPIGPLVLYRRNRYTRDEWRPHSHNSITCAVHAAQRAAGLPQTGPHLLRHTLLTQLAELGASVYVVQAVARHTKLQTTQAYIHQQQVGLTHEAARLLDRASAPEAIFGKTLAKAAASDPDDA